jgi:RNA recognition motif-containing protein
MGGPHYPPPQGGMHGEYGGYAPPPPPPNSSYSFLDPIIPTAKMESPAQNLIKPQKEKVTEVYKKLYIGKIPSDVKDNIIERLLKACGGVESWKRAIDAEGNPKSFGYCEFEDVESAVVCLKVMNGLQVGDNKIMVSIGFCLPIVSLPYTYL